MGSPPSGIVASGGSPSPTNPRATPRAANADPCELLPADAASEADRHRVAVRRDEVERRRHSHSRYSARRPWRLPST
ncbi:MAG: hypothetical protein ACK52I_25930 [Pseudomonadota bacterium]